MQLLHINIIGTLIFWHVFYKMLLIAVFEFTS